MQAKINKSPKRRRSAAPLGGLFLALALIGVATIVYLSIRLTAGFLDNDREKQNFESIIRPVVMFNPIPFESPAAIEMENMLRYAMWATLTGERRSSYEYGDNTELIVPANDLDVAANRLFGPEIELVHKIFGDYDVTYSYIEEDAVYYVPVHVAMDVYTPKVYEITKDGEFYNLLVGYIPPESPWTVDYNGERSDPAPDKYMIYVMRKDGDLYQLVKVQDPPPELLPTPITPS